MAAGTEHLTKLQPTISVVPGHFKNYVGPVYVIDH